MKKIFLFLFCVSIFTIDANAQVLIGGTDEPIDGAILELRSADRGFMPPRVALTGIKISAPLSVHTAGMVVFNTTENDELFLHEGLYLNDGEKWLRLSTTNFRSENWFYMPPIVIDTSTEPSRHKEVDLYAEYKDQKNISGGTTIHSDSAPDKVFSIVPEATDFWYYVTAYDDSVFENIEISATGIMTYSIVEGAMVTDETFINIVFVEK